MPKTSKEKFLLRFAFLVNFQISFNQIFSWFLFREKMEKFEHENKLRKIIRENQKLINLNNKICGNFCILHLILINNFKKLIFMGKTLKIILLYQGDKNFPRAKAKSTLSWLSPLYKFFFHSSFLSPLIFVLSSFLAVDVALKTNWNKYLCFFEFFCLFTFPLWDESAREEKLLFELKFLFFLFKMKLSERWCEHEGGW
jgi:hypothetical protein